MTLRLRYLDTIMLNLVSVFRYSIGGDPGKSILLSLTLVSPFRLKEENPSHQIPSVLLSLFDRLDYTVWATKFCCLFCI